MSAAVLVLARRWLLGALLCLAGAAAWAQGIESVLRPGDVIAGHAKWENECAQCHVRFDRAAQDGLCMSCHKDVGQDVREKKGYHGRLKAAPGQGQGQAQAQGQAPACRSCHTDHRGRQARIVNLDKATFDHSATDHPLRGKHAKVECASCHVPGKKYSQAPHDCVSCHRKDDAHKGTFGAQCTDCHTEESWKQAKFDHSKTRFALSGKHAQAKCESCHRDGKTKELPRNCVSCHREDDRRAHKGQYGERCESCHDTRAWRPSSFNHDTATRFALRGKHRNAKCADCHGSAPVGGASGPVFQSGRDKPASACVDCHRKDDKHKGSLGTECAACHTERDWKERSRFDHDKTAFALKGRHREATCEACHKGTNPKGTPKDCIGCHRADDKHRGTLGTTCADCHTERDWKNASGFDHARTKFALSHAHAVPPLACKSCHIDAQHLRGTPQECYACHKKNDKHEGQLGTRCDSCHNERSWKAAPFDHTRARFALVGRHTQLACKDCHTSTRFRDAPRECVGCHLKDDRHDKRLGADCASCHNSRHWGLGAFDHAKRTRFALEGQHAKLACVSCHVQPAPHGKPVAAVASTCISCHRRDDAHDGAFGTACEQCHTTQGWKRVRPRTGRPEPPTAEGRRP